MATYANMDPFKPFNWKGTADVTAIPVFVDKLPLTIGGLAGVDNYFGRVVSIDPLTNIRKFQIGVPATTNIPVGILVADPVIMAADPAMRDHYYEGRPATAVTFGLIEIKNYDVTQAAPVMGSQVFANNNNGLVAFGPSSGATPTGYTKLNAAVYEVDDPNGVKLWLNYPIAVGTSTPKPTVATPIFNPAAGAISSGTVVDCSTTTIGARLLYTADGSTPQIGSPEWPTGGIVVAAAITFKVVAVKDDYNASSVVTAAYTIS